MPKQSVLSYDKMGRKTGLWDADKSPGTADTTTPWTYSYNALGELLTQKDARGFTTTNSYDKAGRLINRVEKNAAGMALSNVAWSYDNATTAPATGAANSRGQLLSELDSVSGISKTPGYDKYGRINQTTTQIDGLSFASSATFDAVNRPQTQTDASGQSLRLVYTTGHYLKEIQDSADVARHTDIILFSKLHSVRFDDFGCGLRH